MHAVNKNRETIRAVLICLAAIASIFIAGCSDSVEKLSVTGTSSSASVVVDAEKCTWCGICYRACPAGAISENVFVNSDYAYIIDPQKCLHCGVCIGKCPYGAISWKR
jgi:ferredoxin